MNARAVALGRLRSEHDRSMALLAELGYPSVVAPLAGPTASPSSPPGPAWQLIRNTMDLLEEVKRARKRPEPEPEPEPEHEPEPAPAPAPEPASEPSVSEEEEESEHDSDSSYEEQSESSSQSSSLSVHQPSPSAGRLMRKRLNKATAKKVWHSFSGAEPFSTHKFSLSCAGA